MQKLRALLFLVPALLAAGGFTHNLRAASVGTGGYTNSFGGQPSAADWSTFSIAGGGGDVISSAGSDAAVQLISAASVTGTTVSDATVPPAANANATWSSAGFLLQTRPTGNQATLLMCTLANGLGQNAASVTIGYDLSTSLPVAEEVDGHRAFYSLTGTPGSWTLINEFTTNGPGRLTATLNVAWNDNALLYLLWSDDNGSGTPDSVFQIDNFSATAVPAPQVPVAITLNPVSQSVPELKAPVTFTVAASGNLAPTYQWYTNGVAVPNATNTSYSLSTVPYHSNGVGFSVIAQNVASNVTYYATSTVATLTVVPDTISPTLLNAFSLGSTQVVATFSEPVSFETANNLANYAITNLSGPLAVTGAVLAANRTNLTLTTAVQTPEVVYTLIVNGVRDVSVASNAVPANSTATFARTTFVTQNIGNPAIGGTVASVGDAFTLTGAGTGIGSTADQCSFFYQQFTGDFDFQLRVNSLTPTDPWASIGIMARESLNADSRFAGTFATPSIAGVYYSTRIATGANATNAGTMPVNFPYQWIRLQKAGAVFTGYGSYDGQTWNLLGSSTLSALPGTIYVGLAVSSANAGQATTVQTGSYQPTVSTTVAPLVLTREPLSASSRHTGLVISEIMYHPKSRPDGKQLEFIELYNSMSIFEDLSGYRLSGDVSYTFPTGTVMQAGQFIVLAKVKADVESVYGISGVRQYGVTNIVTNIVAGVTNYSTNIDNSLSNGGGTVRLHNKAGAVLLEAVFSTSYPWPIEADGGGHSLVLARPSYGEGQRLAWGASDGVGGSPGTFDPIPADPARNVVINEFLAHTDLPLEDMIELYNHGNTAVDISGFWLSDNVSTNKFRIPDGTVLGPRGFISFTASTNGPPHTGFALSASGEQIVLVNSNQTRVLDAVAFDGQQNGVSMGRYPDGAPTFQRLSAITAGTTNAAPLPSPIVINEIMYNPITGKNDDEFIELYNRGANAVNLGDWRFTDGIDYTFPKNTMIQTGAYVVVAKNAAHLLAIYPNLNATNLFGDYSGSLANNGEHVALSAPDYAVTTNGSGQVLTNVSFRYVMNDLTYGKGGRWGVWADGGGSSLELIDANADNSQPSNWADSDESAKAQWTSFEFTGTVDNQQTGQGNGDSLQVLLLGVGECLLDDIEVRSANNGNANQVVNGSFEGGLSGWTVASASQGQGAGSHDQSFLENTGFSGTKSLHIMAASRGDNAANRIRQTLSPAITGGTATMRAKARWVRGFPEVLLRLRGGGLEAFGRLPVPVNLGTPGARNSRAVTNAGPAIYDVTHNPPLPAASQAVVVTARVNDPNTVTQLVVRYRVEPATTFSSVVMVDNGTGGDTVAGDGLFAATIPGQASGARVAFYVQATDGTGVTNLFPANAVVRSFPNDSPSHECVIRWGEIQMPGSYASYHLWTTDATMSRWLARDRLNNAGLDATFVYNNVRVIYNMSPQYGGSPWHVGSMTGPASGPGGNRVDSVANFPDDDLLLGQTDFVVNTVGNPSGNTSSDPGGLAEQTSYEVFKAAGLVYNYRRYVHFFINGDQRSVTANLTGNFIMEDSQQPNGDMVKEWFPDDADGQLYKIEDWFEFPDDGGNSGTHSNDDADMQSRRTTVNGAANVLKLSPYRFMWRKRSVSAADSANDYTNILSAIDIISPASNPTVSPLPDSVVKQFGQVVDFDQWMRIAAVQHAVGNWDSYGYERGKNCYTYRPNFGKFQLMTWDIDFTLGAGGHVPTQTLFDVSDTRWGAMNNTPETLRAYWRSLQDVANVALNNTVLDPLIDARMRAHAANNVSYNALTNAQIKAFIGARRSYILSQVPPASFAINGATSFASSSNIVTLTGTAPVDVKFIQFNGVNYAITWTATTGWSVRVPLNVAGSNGFNVLAYDRLTNPIAGTARSLIITNTGTIEGPQTNVVFNEIMFNPLIPGAEYVELFNRSTNFTFDISSWQINGLNYTFPAGTYLAPRAFLVLTKDRIQYANAYGGGAPAFNQFTGELQHDGESLTLIKPAASTNETDLVVDKVRYEGSAPWPTAANGTGSSFQLIDAAQDNSRVGDWFSIYQAPVYCCGGFTPAVTNSGWRFVSATGIAGPGIGANQMRLVINLGNGEINGASVMLDDLSIVEGTNAAVGTNFVRNGDFETTPLLEAVPVTNSWFIGTNYTNTAIVGNPVHAGSGALKLVCQTFGNAQPRVVSQLMSPAPLTNAVHTLSFWYNATNSATNLTVKILNSGPLNITTNVGVFVIPASSTPPTLVTPGVYTLTPGAANQGTTNLPAFPTLWINELQADNVNGIFDNNGEREPWIELYNAGDSPVSLDGLYLSTTYTNLTNFAIPAGYSIGPTQFMVIICDNEPGESTPSQLHTGFRLTSGSGSIALSRLYTNAPQVLDYINYAGISANRSYGSYPDGQPFDRQEFFYVTAGTNNDGRSAPLVVFINEWMANNASYLADPADNDNDDWFELYNPATNAVDIAGYYLTDTLANKFKYLITTNGPHIIPAQGFLLVWADNETGQNVSGGVPRPDLHVNFQLATASEAIGLFAADGTQIDAINFTNAQSNVSEGRYPNGGPLIYSMPTSQSPRASNFVPGIGNNPPVLDPIGGKTVFVNQLLSFTATASDPDVGQTRVFTLDAGSPPGAAIDFNSGAFTWTPGLAGTNLITIRVTDNGSPALSDSENVQIHVLPLPDFAVPSLAGNELTLSWSATGGRTYQVKFKNSLNDAEWTNFGPPLTVESDGLLSISDDISLSPTGQRYYQLVVLP